MEQLVKIPQLSFDDEPLVIHCVFEILKKHLITELTKIPNIGTFKLGIVITTLVCKAVENSVITNKDEKIDKKKLVLEVLTSIFALTPAEQTLVGQQIEFLLSNKIVVKIKKAVSTRIYHKIAKISFPKKKKV